MLSLGPSGPVPDGLQISFYVGINIENIMYGVALVLYFKTMGILLRSKGARKKSNLFYALFSSMMIFSITVWISTSAIFGEKMWLLDSDFPGGPNAYWSANISVWYMDWAMAAVIFLQLMTDGLMIHRCRIIWNSHRAIVIPIILWFVTLVLGGLVAWTSSVPGGDFFNGVAAQFGVAYYAVSVFLHSVLTGMICYRILRHGRMVRENLGREYASLYYAVVMLVVESVLPYTLSGIAFLASLGMRSPTSTAFVALYFLMMCISPQILILQVIVGRALNNDTLRQPGSTLNFTPDGVPGSQRFDGGITRVHLQTSSDVSLPDAHGKVEISQV